MSEKLVLFVTGLAVFFLLVSVLHLGRSIIRFGKVLLDSLRAPWPTDRFTVEDFFDSVARLHPRYVGTRWLCKVCGSYRMFEVDGVVVKSLKSNACADCKEEFQNESNDLPAAR